MAKRYLVLLIGVLFGGSWVAAPIASSQSVQVACIGGALPNGNPRFPDLTFVSASVRRRSPDLVASRLHWDATVRNSGNYQYPVHQIARCRTIIRMTLTLERGAVDEVRVYDNALAGTIGPGQSRDYSGDDGVTGEITPTGQRYFPVVFSIDPDGTVPESNNNNNTLTGCYDYQQETYSNGACPS